MNLKEILHGTTVDQGIILVSTDEIRYKITIVNDGTLAVIAV